MLVTGIAILEPRETHIRGEGFLRLLVEWMRNEFWPKEVMLT
jgi:hypothetical protein